MQKLREYQCHEPNANRAGALPEGDEHRDSKHAVENCGPHHRSGKLERGISKLLGHVSTSVWSNEAPYWSGETDEARQAYVAPTSAVTSKCQLTDIQRGSPHTEIL